MLTSVFKVPWRARRVPQSLLGFCSALTPKAQAPAWAALLQKAEAASGARVHPIPEGW